jgi:hypothetical protein
MAVTRPLKEGSVTTYQQKVALGFPDILASEMDADLDTIYAAWNGNIDTANLVDGAVTTAKLATAPNGVATGNLNDASVTTAKLAGAPNGVATGKLNDGAVTTAKLAVGATLVWIGQVAGIYATVVTTGGVTLMTLNINPPRSGTLLVRAWVPLQWQPAAAGLQTVTSALYWLGSPVRTAVRHVNATTNVAGSTFAADSWFWHSVPNVPAGPNALVISASATVASTFYLDDNSFLTAEVYA